MKKDVYYFSHDATAQDDPKCMVLIDQLGMEGYGIFWALIEKLRSEKDYKLPLIVCGSYAKRWGTSKEKVEAVIKNYNLFCIESDLFFYSARLCESMNYKSLVASNNAKKRWDSNSIGMQTDATAMQPHTTALQLNATAMQTNAIKGKESKVKESKVNKESIKKNFLFTPPTIEEVCLYFNQNGYTEEGAIKAFNFYDVENWVDSRGNKVRSWKQKMQSVWFKDEYKLTAQNTQKTQTPTQKKPFTKLRRCDFKSNSEFMGACLKLRENPDPFDFSFPKDLTKDKTEEQIEYMEAELMRDNPNGLRIEL